MALTDEFLMQVEDSLLARVVQLCGTGAEAYQSPDYLQIQQAEVGMVVPDFEIHEDTELPLFKVQYFYSEPAGVNTGMAGDDRLTHYWNLGVVLRLSRDIMGLQNSSDTVFYRNVIAAGRTLMERVRRAVHFFAPDVSDSSFTGTAQSSDLGRVTLVRPWFQRQDADAYTVLLLYEWVVESEILS